MKSSGEVITVYIVCGRGKNVMPGMLCQECSSTFFRNKIVCLIVNNLILVYVRMHCYPVSLISMYAVS